MNYLTPDERAELAELEARFEQVLRMAMRADDSDVFRNRVPRLLEHAESIENKAQLLRAKAARLAANRAAYDRTR
jgi:hypothetical protein